MPYADANGIRLYYEELGRGEPLVLVMGIGAQLVLWPDGFCEELARRGFRVIRFDNRDVGLSTKLSEAGVPHPARSLSLGLLGLPVEAPYDLVDMADDVAGLLDALGLARAHVAGCSLGGMVAQTVALAHPHRVATLTSIMSTPGGRRNSLAKPAALAALLAAAPRSEEDTVAWYVRFFRAVGGKGFAFDEDFVRNAARAAYRRSHDPRGFARQLAAMMKTGDRRGALRFVRAPTLVLHGSDDPLILPAAGRATARAIPGARLRIVEGMGHDLPRGAWPILAGEIESIARQRPAADPTAPLEPRRGVAERDAGQAVP